MNYLRNLWNKFTGAVDEFIGDLLGEDTLALTELDSQQVTGVAETDSYESWQ